MPICANTKLHLHFLSQMFQVAYLEKWFVLCPTMAPTWKVSTTTFEFGYQQVYNSKVNHHIP
jgi:hypothetical protein